MRRRACEQRTRNQRKRINEVAKRERVGQYVGWGLSLVGLAWVAILIARQWDSVERILRSASFPALGVAFLLFAGALLFNAALFGRVVDSLAASTSPKPLYQAAKAQNAIPAPIVVRANLDHLALSLVFNVSVAVTIILARQQDAVALAVTVAVLSVAVMAAGMRWNLPGRAVGTLGRILPQRLRDSFRQAADTPDYSWSAVTAVMVYSFGSWALYLAGFAWLEHAFTELQGVDMLLAAAYYSLAWVIGFVAILTPSGLGVREVSFVVLAGSIAGEPVLVFLAVIVRIWVMVTELVVAGVASLGAGFWSDAEARLSEGAAVE